MCDLLWSDPGTKDGLRRSRRGLGILFGPDITKRFLKANELELVVRSHEVKDRGFDVEHDGKCVTIFSAPNYCDSVGNKGAVLVFHHGVDNGGQNCLWESIVGEDGAIKGEDGAIKGRVADQLSLSGKLRAQFLEFSASKHPNKDKRSLSNKLAEMGFLPKAFPY